MRAQSKISDTCRKIMEILYSDTLTKVIELENKFVSIRWPVACEQQATNFEGCVVF